MTANEALAIAIKALNAASVPDAANDARILLAHAMGIERSRLTLVLSDEINTTAQSQFEQNIAARCQRQPVSQITGTRAFYGRDFIVTPDVLDPRPETELLVVAALAQSFETVLDLGTGSGCILLTLLVETKNTNGVGVDCSAAALAIARQNSDRFNLMNRCQFIRSSWFENMSDRHDLIVANPPYITAEEMTQLAPEVADWEPKIALTSGVDGLEAYRIITKMAPQHLTPNGRLIVEIGHTQAEAVCNLFAAAGFNGITTLQDMSGHDRVVLGGLK